MSEPNSDPQRSRSTSRTVLIADDDPLNRQLTQRVLETRGWTVATVADGEAALARVAERPFDLVLLDVEMPGLDGPGVARRIRAGEPADGGQAARTKLVALTSHRHEAERRRCLDAGMDGYLTKPFDPEALAALMEGEEPPRDRDESPPGAATVDWDHAIEAVRGDRELLQRLAVSAGAEVRQRLADLTDALAAQAPEPARLAAHSLHGALRIFGAERARALAAEIEAGAAGGRLTASAALLARLADEVETVSEALAEGPARALEVEEN